VSRGTSIFFLEGKTPEIIAFWCECINIIACNFKFAKGDALCAPNLQTKPILCYN
jgi:hypothetical protein